ncbi:MAG: N-acetylmuramoyl-L-alanine amidase [Candidatus Omnitrophica bacterium]|nr:N-acetylmuramoyl-L-alanine amidase [Candidatus Omnitrophota bacterium]MDD5592296.1 N-acetylmuramoyl-L-alanine amidase [Candidatus Omnitrophota bacterium]
MNKVISFCLIVGLVFILNSCVTAPIKPPITPAKEVYPHTAMPVLRQDASHIVAPGETLWRISKMYNVPIKDISSANNLKTQTLGKGQRLLIPNAAPIVPVIPLYHSKKWKYIVIHHSATDEGNSLQFDKYHQSKGWEGIGYHFVIDNGTKGKQDGQIEVSPRWIKQEGGSHCRAGNMNEKAIGICLVGNFNREYVSSKQLDALVYLVNVLRKYYKIPVKRITGHNQVLGARTECPGKNFPWTRFKNSL